MSATLEHLTSFAVVILVQFLFFVVHSIIVGERSTIFKHLGQGMLLGLPFGIIFDLCVGKFVGMYEYQLGFMFWFLTINGLFSFGFMMANVRLLYHHTLKHLYVWSVLLALVYELTNYFFPVWNWTFASSATIEYAFVILIAYTGITVLMMGALKLTYRVHFRLLPF
ncbi:MAG: hypothetical protein KBB78_03005 [Candidatus Pacebacteria bacterium]|nr:hypothetical protein [Candidatus Paceibacterota bacterium]